MVAASVDLAAAKTSWRQAPFACVGGLLSVKQLSSVHCLQAVGTQSVGSTVMLATQAPFEHMSPVEQVLPSSQVVPFGASGSEQVPEAGSQTPAAWQTPWAVQVFAAPPEQEPAWQDSPVVQAFPSVQEVPLATGGFEQVPETASQVPAAWH